jgi:hypothetical protein
MSRQSTVVVGIIVIGLAAFSAWSIRAGDRAISAGFWFDEAAGHAMDGVTDRLGGPMTAPELRRIESLARAELRVAFANTRLMLGDSPAANYRVRVVRDLGGGARSLLPVAGASRPLPGRRGIGEVNFGAIANAAVAYAPADAARETIIDAIGRGIGRSAVHEFAHQILVKFELHDTADRRSYEYEDLRPEHFYGDVHWSIAAKALQDRIGLVAAGRPALESR